MEGIKPVGEPLQMASQNSRGSAGFAAHLGDYDAIHVGDGLTDLRFDAFHQIFQAATESLVR
jgi:hypothetical protein